MKLYFDCGSNFERDLRFFAHAGNRTQGTSMGGLYVATTLHARTACKINAMLSSADAVSAKPHMLLATEEGALPDDTLAEWLRRRPAKPMGSPCVGSNPTGVAFAADNIRRQTKQGQRRWRDPCDAVDKGGCAADTKTDPPQTRHGRSRARQVAAQLPFGSNYWIVLAFATT